MAIRINYSSSSLSKNLDKMGEKLGALVLMYSATKAQELESKMKVNRPWTDRTGMAKATLSARVSQPDEKTIRITLAHGVEYGIWLELANEQRYAIINPTIQQEGPKLIEDLNGILNKLKL